MKTSEALERSLKVHASSFFSNGGSRVVPTLLAHLAILLHELNFAMGGFRAFLVLATALAAWHPP